MFENPRTGRQARNFTTNVPKILDLKSSSEQILDSVSIDNEYDYESEILPLTIMRMRFAQNMCSTRSGNSFHNEISSKSQSARNEFLKGKVYLL